ncbi:hypothetical protein MNBD_GAMMA26-2312 [hydrothermal vent metagenome]|uniref:Sulfatase-modifying factor enzyme-like domain-containing protein n=1 Tax=hydrothermal vent metagenome TaxID=652676 RepID=A0A3B1BFG2_9ZZZZ
MNFNRHILALLLSLCAGALVAEVPVHMPENTQGFGEFRSMLGNPTAIEVPQWDDNQFDPKPDEDNDDELILPLPCGGAMVFRRIEVGGNEGWLGEQQIELGSPSEIDAPLDYRRVAYISGTFSGEDQDPRGGHHYYLGKYEITDLQYQAVMGDCPETTRGRRPAVKVSWYDGVEFSRRYTEWLYEYAPERLPKEDELYGFLRLPTEVEWEYAARGGNKVTAAEFQKSLFPMEAEVMEYAWIRESASASFKPRPIGSLKPNPLGLYDILGNVSELIFDLFRLSTNGHLHGQAGGFLVKGGHFRSWRNTLRASWRREHPHFNLALGKPTRLETVGFRLVISAPVMTSEQRIKTLAQEWESLPKETAVATGGGDGCSIQVDEVSAALQAREVALDQCLVDAGQLQLLKFPDPPLPLVAAPGRLPAWFKLRDTVEYMDAAKVRQHGIWFHQTADADKALLLFKIAARKGDGWSALAIGAMYDPLLFESQSFNSRQTAFSKANLEMAYCWYLVARDLGERRAKPRLDALVASGKGIDASGKISAGCIKVMQKYGGKNPE